MIGYLPHVQNREHTRAETFAVKFYPNIVRSCFLVIIGVGIGWYGHKMYRAKFVSHHKRMVHAQGFRYTSPLLDVELPEGMGVNDEPMPFKQKLLAFVTKQTASGQATEVSVFYRDLLDGPWFGIGENREFNPASMMKVAIMVGWLKRAEKDQRVLKKMMTYTYNDDMRAMQNIKPAQSAEPGRSYSVDELLHFMMNFSDNNATRLLMESLDPAELQNVLAGMDIDNRPNDRGQNSITVHGYSGFFRILYNASYLNRELSEKALQLLSLEDFPRGIIAGVPRGTVVASKYGESAEGVGDEIKQLHEFGIVYHARHPYLLGIMTRGRDFDALARVIQDVSRLVYSEVDTDHTITGEK